MQRTSRTFTFYLKTSFEPVVLNPCLTWEIPSFPPVLGKDSHLKWAGTSCSNLFFKESEDESLFLFRVLACFHSNTGEERQEEME